MSWRQFVQPLVAAHTNGDPLHQDSAFFDTILIKFHVPNSRHRRARPGFGPKSLEMQSKRFEIDRIGLKSNRNTFVAINIRFQSQFPPESTRIPSMLKIHLILR